MTNELIVHRDDTARGHSRDLGRYQPRTFSEVLEWGEVMMRAGGFVKTLASGAKAPLNQYEIARIVNEGDEYGMTPMQSLRNIHAFVDRDGVLRTIVGYMVIAARIQADEHVEQFEWEADDDHCAIVAKRRGRPAVRAETYWAQLTDQDRRRHQSHREDILFGRTVRKLGRRGFADLLLGITFGPEATDIIDVQAVEEKVKPELPEMPPCTQSVGEDGQVCAEQTELVAAPQGGAYLLCRAGHRTPPPQEVRDLIRGYKERHDALVADPGDRVVDPDPGGDAGDNPVDAVAEPDWVEAEAEEVDGEFDVIHAGPAAAGHPAGDERIPAGAGEGEPDPAGTGGGPGGPDRAPGSVAPAAGGGPEPRPAPAVPAAPVERPGDRARRLAAEMAKRDSSLPPHIRHLKHHIEKNRTSSTVSVLTAHGWDINMRQPVGVWLSSLSPDQLRAVAESFGTTVEVPAG